ncbi:MAG: dienelactone hydrolase family protein [Inquilinaceae bacterium]
MRPRRIAAMAIAAVLTLSAGSSAWSIDLATGPWPDRGDLSGIAGQAVTFPSHSPFVPSQATDTSRGETVAQGTLFLPDGASADRPAPAVVLLHGAGGVLQARELTYGRQFASMGIAALAVDAFAARRDRASGFTERLLEITETMLVADAYAGLAYLAERPDIDPDRVVIVGFSYGAMASVFAAYDQVAKALSPDGLRFAGHVAFYGPCIARFDQPRTTGRPVLMLAGAEDAIVDPARCAEIADDLRAGGSDVETVTYPGAYHQWDGSSAGPRRIGRNLAACRLAVNPDGQVRDERTYLPMYGPMTRRLILASCVDGEGYMIGRDDAIRALSNRDMGRFLERVLGLGGA